MLVLPVLHLVISYPCALQQSDSLCSLIYAEYTRGTTPCGRFLRDVVRVGFDGSRIVVRDSTAWLSHDSYFFFLSTENDLHHNLRVNIGRDINLHNNSMLTEELKIRR